MLNKSNAVCITDYDESEIKILINEGIKGGIFLFTDHNNSFYSLTPEHIGQVKRYAPHPADIYFTLPSNGNYLTGQPISFGDKQSVRFSDIWVDKPSADKVLGKCPDNAASEETKKYSTRLIGIMMEAIKKFWENYSPDSEATPKAREILIWLEKKGLSAREARAIDLIIRPDHLRKGGNKKLKKTSKV